MRKVFKNSRGETILGIIGFFLLLYAVSSFVFSLNNPNSSLWRAFIGFGLFFTYVIIISFFIEDIEDIEIKTTPIQDMNPSKRKTNR